MKQMLIRFGLWLLMGGGLAYPQAVAQTQRGVGWWSGGGNWRTDASHQFQNKTNQTTLNLSIAQGTFIRDNLLLGADLRLSRFRDLSQQGTVLGATADSRQTTFTATPFVRRYWGTALRGYVGGGLALTYGRDRLLTAITQSTVSERDVSRWRVAPEFQAGLFYSVSPRWGLEVSTRSDVLPLAFTGLNLGLVLLTDVARPRKTGAGAAPVTSTVFSRGRWVLGGGFEVGNRQQQLTSGTDKLTAVQRQGTRQFSLAPAVGYMAGRRWQVGVAIPYRYQTLTNEFTRTTAAAQIGTVETSSIGVEPFAKKYLFAGPFGPFLSARGGWRVENVSGEGTAPSRSTGYSWRVGGGLAYVPGNHFLVEAELVCVGTDWLATDRNDRTQNSTEMSLTLRPALLLAYVF